MSCHNKTNKHISHINPSDIVRSQLVLWTWDEPLWKWLILFIHTLLILLLRHHEDIMMRLEELKRQKAANEDIEVFTDERRTQIFHIQIEGFTKLNTWISANIRVAETKTRESTHTRDSPRSKNLVRFCLFLFLTKRILKGIWTCTRQFGDRCQTLRPIKSWEVANRVMWGSTHWCHVWQTSTYTLFCFRLAAWLSIFSRSTSGWFTLTKHIKIRKKAIHTQYTYKMLPKL